MQVLQALFNFSSYLQPELVIGNRISFKLLSLPLFNNNKPFQQNEVLIELIEAVVRKYL